MNAMRLRASLIALKVFGCEGSTELVVDAIDRAVETLGLLRGIAGAAGGGQVEITETDHRGVRMVTFELRDPLLDGGPPFPRPSLAYAIDGDLLIIGVDASFTTAVLDGEAADSLASQPAYRNALDAAGGGSNAGAMYFDVEPAVAIFDSVARQQMGRFFEDQLRDMRSVLGAAYVLSHAGMALSTATNAALREWMESVDHTHFILGSVVGQRNILKDFGGRNISWLISESPLVDGNHVIVTPGGRNAGMVALDKMTGRTVWVSRELSDEAGYASPIVADVQGVRTIMTLTAEAGVGVRASDGKLMFRDRAALTFMLLAPFLLTIGMGFVTGRFSGSSSGLSDIPVVVVNLDHEQLGNALADLFASEELADLMEPTNSSDPEAARGSIDEDQAAAAVIIPQGFTDSIIPADGTVSPALAPGASVRD